MIKLAKSKEKSKIMARKNLLKLIIFDIYGVILSSGYPDTCQYLARKFQRDYQQIYKILYLKHFNQAAERKISQQEAWQKAIDELGLPLTVRELKEIHYSLMKVNKKVIRLIQHLKGKVKMVMLSKNTRSQLAEVNKRLNLKRYMPIINTWEIGLPKASSETIKFLSKKFKVGLEELLIIDDQEANLKPALKMGVKTILYQNFRQFKKELKRYVQ